MYATRFAPIAFDGLSSVSYAFDGTIRTGQEDRFRGTAADLAGGTIDEIWR